MKRRKMLLLCTACVMAFSISACGLDEEVQTETVNVEQISDTQNDIQKTDSIKNAGNDTEKEESNVEEETVEEEAVEEDYEYEGDAASSYNEQYGEVLDQYYTALTEKWEEEKLLSEGMSNLTAFCYDGNPLENLGYAYVDVNNDGYWELLIGALNGDEFTERVVFDLYALEDGVPVQIFSSMERSRYYICEEEAGGYQLANVGSGGASFSGWHYYILNGTQMQVIQAIMYDIGDDPEHPWYMAYDDDWDVTNDTPIEEKLAEDIIASYEGRYMLLEDFDNYFSFQYYKFIF